MFKAAEDKSQSTAGTQLLLGPNLYEGIKKNTLQAPESSKALFI